jgi:hypothetical protein
MLSSEFWRGMAPKFRAIPDHGMLRADWSITVKAGDALPPTASWRFAGLDRNTRSMQYEFDALARQCGPKVYPNMDSLDGWLEELRSRRLNAGATLAGHEYSPDNVLVSNSYSGTISSVCQASADLCRILESLALETERMAAISQSAALTRTTWLDMIGPQDWRDEAEIAARKEVLTRQRVRELEATEGHPASLNPEIRNQDATLHSSGPNKKIRQSKAPVPELLKNQNGTLTRIQAADALGMSLRNFDRLKAQQKLKPVGPKSRKRYLVKDLLHFLHQRN